MNQAFVAVSVACHFVLRALLARFWLRRIPLYAIGFSLSSGLACAAEGSQELFVHLSLEELGNIQVTSVSKKEERLAEAAASIYVISEEAIRRSGARSLPEALALAPNLQVAQINAYQYAISARGFNSNTANKLLVMIDGRAIYTPLYSGVFWDVQDVSLPDIERIEVVSGPGGTLWGANAINGVINIISKRASQTTGELFHVDTGNAGSVVAFRHGATFTEGAYRVYAKLAQGRHTVRADGAAVADAWDRAQLGFRSDWRSGASELTLQGDSYRGSNEQLAGGLSRTSGSNLLALWRRLAPDGSGFRVQTYLDHTSRDAPGVFSEKLSTLDFDLQYLKPEADGKQWIWGFGYRVSDDNVGNTAVLAFLPARRKLHWANLFVQQERTVLPGVKLTVGAKLESNHYSGVEFLPNLKLAWKPAEDRLLWASVSRAVRAPSRIDAEIFIPGKPPYQLAGGPDFRSELANTLELGMRAQLGNLTTTLVGFHSEYDQLRSVDKLASGVLVLGNQIKGRVNGLEASLTYQATKTWSVSASTLMLNESFNGPNLAQSSPGNDPKSQWTLVSKWDISQSMQADLLIRHVGSLPSPLVPATTTVDARYGWSISKNLELAVAARNLFDARQQAFASGSSSPIVNPIQLERAINISMTVKF